MSGPRIAGGITALVFIGLADLARNGDVGT